MSILPWNSEDLIAQKIEPILMRRIEQAEQKTSAPAPTGMQAPGFGQALLNFGAAMSRAQAQGMGFAGAFGAGGNAFGGTMQHYKDKREEEMERADDRILASYKDILSGRMEQQRFNLNRQNIQNQIATRNAGASRSQREFDLRMQQLKDAEERRVLQQQYLIDGGMNPDMVNAFPEIAAQRAFASPKDRRIVEQGGVQYYADTGEPVIANPVKGADLSLTKGEEAVDKEFAKEYVEFNAAGGYADVDKQLGQLEEVVGALESGENLTGFFTGQNPTRALTNPKSVDAQEKVEEVVQRNLRTILGAQFTEKEGERLISRAYNPKLDEKTNAKRLRALIGQMRGAAEAKQRASDYFRANGTLKGWEGQLPSVRGFDAFDAIETGAGDEDPLGLR